MSNLIELETFGTILVARFISAKDRNALSSSVLSELESLLITLDADNSIEKLIFTEQDNIFASGADLREISSLAVPAASAFARRGQAIMDRIAELSAEVIAAVNGHCYGGALDLALACDKRISAPTAAFCHPGAGLGIITGWGGTQRLPRLVGETNALSMFFTASPIPASEAIRIGLIDLITENPLAEAFIH